MEPHVLHKKPYARIVVPEADGSFTAEIVEFPGCVANGNTAAEAISNVEEVALNWIEAALEQGQDIPEPLEQSCYSGRLVVRMPKGLHKRAALAAEREGVSLNQYLVTCIAEHVGMRSHPTASSSQKQIRVMIAPCPVAMMPQAMMISDNSLKPGGPVTTSSGFMRLPSHMERVRA